MSEDRAAKIQWIQDSGGTMTCHVNDGKLNFKDSLICTLDYRSDGWHVILKDNTDITPEGLPSLARAMAHFNKEIPRSYGVISPKEHAKEIGMTPAEIKASRMKPRDAQPGKNWDEIKKHNWDQ